MWIIEKILTNKICLGFDLVEFSPIEKFHGYDFTAAQLVYNIMGFISRSDINIEYYGIKI
jgi:agmatinase